MYNEDPQTVSTNNPNSCKPDLYTYCNIMHLSTSLWHTIYVHHLYHLHASRSGPGSYDGYRLCPTDIYSTSNLWQCCATAATHLLVTCKVFMAKQIMTSLRGYDSVEPDRQVPTLRRNLPLFLFIC